MRPSAVRNLVSIVVPVYDSAATLAELAARIDHAMVAAGLDYELLFVDDASADGTRDCLHALAQQNGRIRLLRHKQNAGQTAAVINGISHARGLLLVTLDDDLEHRPEDIPHLVRVAAANERALAMAVPLRRQRPRWRDALSIPVNVISNIFLARPLPVRLTTFCAFHRGLAERCLSRFDRRHVAVTASLVQAADSTLTVPVAMDPTGLPHSRYRLRALWSLFRGRMQLFLVQRAALLAAATAGVTVLLTATSLWPGGPTSRLLIGGVMAAIAVGASVLLWLMLVDRHRASRNDRDSASRAPLAEIQPIAAGE